MYNYKKIPKNSSFAIRPSDEELQKKIANNLTFHDNLGERILTISESKLKLCLKDNMDNMENRKSWLTPAGLFLTVVITLLTCNFKNWMISSQTWQAVFIISGILSFGWLIVAICKIPKYKNVEDILNEMMPLKDIPAKIKISK